MYTLSFCLSLNEFHFLSSLACVKSEQNCYYKVQLHHNIKNRYNIDKPTFTAETAHMCMHSYTDPCSCFPYWLIHIQIVCLASVNVAEPFSNLLYSFFKEFIKTH